VTPAGDIRARERARIKSGDAGPRATRYVPPTSCPVIAGDKTIGAARREL